MAKTLSCKHWGRSLILGFVSMTAIEATRAIAQPTYLSRAKSSRINFYQSAILLRQSQQIQSAISLRITFWIQPPCVVRRTKHGSDAMIGSTATEINGFGCDKHFQVDRRILSDWQALIISSPLQCKNPLSIYTGLSESWSVSNP